MDTFEPAFRSEVMARIKAKDTKPELLVRRALHRLGFRYSLHSKVLPGRPDLVMPKYQTVVFVDGCFWHQHSECKFASLPKSNTEYWIPKLAATKERDRRNRSRLRQQNWRVFTVWECGVKLEFEETVALLAKAIRTENAVSQEFPPYPPKPK